MPLDLAPHPTFPGVEGPVLLVVMDGVGIGKGDEADAVALARTPTLDALRATAFGTELRAHGKAVGLPSDGDMGNSEVGHNALGAGRIFDQGAKRVAEAIASGDLYQGTVWKSLLATVRESGEPIHFVGLLSDGNVHSHIDHLFSMLRRCHDEGIARARIHVLLDGRDVSETSALAYVEPLERLLGELNTAGRDYRIASGGGRMVVTMDRYEADWAMVERGWNLHVRGEGRGFRSAAAAIRTFREEDPGVIDQFLPGFVVVDDEGAVGPIRDGAAVVMFNFRGDRALELTRAFTDEGFDAFDRNPRPKVAYAGMMQYDGDLLLPRDYLVEPPSIDRTMGEYLSRAGVRQFACSETQKFGHVTYFWNGNRSGRFDDALETYLEIESDSVPFEQRPWMKAAEITDAVLTNLTSYRHLRINLANGDMVGHTGDRDASILAVEVVDLCLRRLIEPVTEAKGALIVTADHGNADEMFERDKKTGVLKRDAAGELKAKTSHTLNPVPFLVHAPSVALGAATVERPGLGNVAATTLALLGFAPPEGYLPSLVSPSPRSR
ncbi:MAG: 2,3-bisphosphoglycerate-independent phosphoglycerate mutase [Myxococcota bacterium]